ncbi:MAG: hypothetical protein Q9216_003515 [Gyalolechia sp. 2 TL-2023]
MLRSTQFSHVFALMALLLVYTYASPLTLTSHNLTASNRVVTCTDSQRWIPHGVMPFPHNCYDALEHMRQIEGNKRADQRFEFLARDARQITRLLPLWTPRIYTVRTCTIAVTMLSSYKPWDLPPETPPESRRGPYPTSETATLAELIAGAQAVVTSCVEQKGQGGWDAEGWSRQGIAVTAWQTRSPIDRLVHAQIPPQLEDFATNGVSEA